MTLRPCPLCNQTATDTTTITERDKSILTFECSICGSYTITHDAMHAIIEDPKYTKYKEKISAFTHSRSIRKMDKILLSETKVTESTMYPSITLDETIADFPRSFSERIDRVLINLSIHSLFAGESIYVHSGFYPMFYCENNTPRSIGFMIRQLISEGFIMDVANAHPPVEITLSGKGWNKVYELESTRTPNTKKVFIAMWFHESMKDVSENGFKKAIVDAGYEPFRIDDREFNGDINDEIIAEIRQSKFVVCDFTGHRGGVYFEAGFALGLGLPVIWTCHKDHVNDIHFDTQQYNHIEWESKEDLYKKLLNRIKATIV